MATRRAVIAGLAASAAAAARPARAQTEVNVVALGADPTGATNSTEAFQAAARSIEQAGGGRLIIPPGRYRVGRQGAGATHALQGADIVSIRHCAAPIEIEADGATLFLTEGLRFGSFDPTSGEAFEPQRLPFVDHAYAASLGIFFNFEDNAEVTLTGLLTLDGAIERQVIGGRWGDAGRQVSAIGVRAYNNRAFTLKGLRSRGQGLDDLVIGWQGLTEGHPAYPHVVEDVQGEGAGRNGLSWVGGNSLALTDCRFEHCGGRGGGPVASSPGAGIDIEAEEAVCRNGVFTRVACIDNRGCGLVADSGDSADSRFEDCRFVGVANWAAWPRKPRMSFSRCQFVGPIVNLYGAGPPEDAVRFVDCVNTLDPARSPTGMVYPHVSDFTSGKGALWQGGMVDLAGMPGFNAAGGPDGMRWKDTRIVGTASGGLYAKGRFQGEVEIDYPNGVWDPAGGAVIEGRLTARSRPPGGGEPKVTILDGPTRR